MNSWDLQSLNTRNKFMLLICWGLTFIGVLSAGIAVGSTYAFHIAFAGFVIFGIPTVLVWKKKHDRCIMYYIVLIFSISGYLLEPAFEIYILTFVYSVILSLYFDYRPVLLMGISNIIFTVYFVYRYYDGLLQSEHPLHHLIPLVSIHILVTIALVTQSIIGERLRTMSAKMERLSKTDALTGLYNHKMFYEYLDQQLGQRAEGRYRKLHLAVIDIDNFKCINDTYGHATGDLIIRRVSETIRLWITSDDFAARYGGEEFAIIFTNKTMHEAYSILENIRKTLARFPHPEAGHKPVTISAGLKEMDKLVSKSELFSQADELLYAAKRGGKNQTAAD